MNYPGPHNPRQKTQLEHVIEVTDWLSYTLYRNVLPMLERIEKRELEIMATQAEFRSKLQAFFTEVETRLANVQKAIDDAIAAHVAGDSAAFDSLSQDVADEMAKISTGAQPLAGDTGATVPTAPTPAASG